MQLRRRMGDPQTRDAHITVGAHATRPGQAVAQVHGIRRLGASGRADVQGIVGRRIGVFHVRRDGDGPGLVDEVGSIPHEGGGRAANDADA